MRIGSDAAMQKSSGNCYLRWNSIGIQSAAGLPFGWRSCPAQPALSAAARRSCRERKQACANGFLYHTVFLCADDLRCVPTQIGIAFADDLVVDPCDQKKTLQTEAEAVTIVLP